MAVVTSTAALTTGAGETLNSRAPNEIPGEAEVCILLGKQAGGGLSESELEWKRELGGRVKQVEMEPIDFIVERV